MSKLTGSKKATQFTESVIREMTRLNHLYGGGNLSQGFPDFPAPAAGEEAAWPAVNTDVKQYAGTAPKYVPLHEPGVTCDPDELAAAFSNKTKAIILNTPNNPTGKVFTREELQYIAGLCQKWDTLCITDEIYE